MDIGRSIILRFEPNPSDRDLVQMRRGGVIVILVKFGVDNSNSLVDWVSILRTGIADVGEVSVNLAWKICLKVQTMNHLNVLAGPLYIILPRARRVRRSKRENTSQLG